MSLSHTALNSTCRPMEFSMTPPSAPHKPPETLLIQQIPAQAHKCMRSRRHTLPSLTPMHTYTYTLSGRVKRYSCDEAAIVPPYPCPQRPLAALHYGIICLQFYSRVGTWNWRCIHTVRFSSFPFVHWKESWFCFFNLHSVLVMVRS